MIPTGQLCRFHAMHSPISLTETYNDLWETYLHPTSAVLKIDGNVWIDIDHFNIWLSLDKDEVSDFRNLRTKEPLLTTCRIKASKLEDWLRKRHWNGLDEAVIKKGEKRLYIDIQKFNHWLEERNQNPDFGC
jgi:hypothetical protein